MKYFLVIKNVADIHKFIWKGDIMYYEEKEIYNKTILAKLKIFL